VRFRTAALTAPLVLAIALAANAADAASRVVVVEDANRATRDATARLRAELVAAGFDVEARSAREVEPERDVEDEGGESVATVRLVRVGRRTELWVSDRLTGKTLVRRVNADPEKNPRLVAIRGVELLRASLLELTSPPHDEAPPATPALAAPPPPEVQKLVGPPPAPPPTDTTPKTPPPPPKRWADRVALDAGVLLLGSTEGLGAAFAPTLAAWLPLPGPFALRPRVAGPAFRSGVSNAFGSADTRQELATLEIAWAPFDGVVVPFVAAGGGVYHLHVEGHPASPQYHAASDEVFAAIAGGGLGADFRIAPAVALSLEGRAFAITPHPQVAIGNTRVAETGAPALVGAASLVAAF
jgi:hypothetical protein